MALCIQLASESHLKNVNTLLTVGALLFASLFSLYLYSGFYRSYSDEVYELRIHNRIYDLKNPRQRWDLPKELEEISGLSYFMKDELACVQDEDGIFYTYDLKKRKIKRRDQFSDRGDYEGVEVISNLVYVLKSNGNVYRFELEDNGIGEVNKIKTDLLGRNDTEGLGYQVNSEELLLACKEEPGTKYVDIKKGRSIYSISLPESEFMKRPKYILDGKSYNKILENKGLSKKRHKPFKPSGIAVHPKTGHIFIIGTVGKMMVVLSPQGEIEDLIPLDPKIFWQPEGICFDPKGNLYISSEGRGKKGYILKF